MSNVGQVALTVVGTVVGAYLGYPALGFQLGYLAGSTLFPTQLAGITGPKLEDLNTTQAQVGNPLPIVHGTIAVTASAMWLAPVVTTSTTETVGGKGSAEQNTTNFTYTQSIAFALCEGPIAGIRRVWENGDLVYDLRAQFDDESDEDYSARVASNTEYEGTFTLYLGDNEQLPDPTIESIEGVGNVPAFREVAYIVFPDRQLTDEQGRRHPSLRVEVYKNGALDCDEGIEYSNEYLLPWSNPAFPYNDDATEYSYTITVGYSGDVDEPVENTGPYESIAAANAAVSSRRGKDMTTYMGYFFPDSNQGSVMGGNTIASDDLVEVKLHYNALDPSNPLYADELSSGGDQGITNACLRCILNGAPRYLGGSVYQGDGGSVCYHTSTFGLPPLPWEPRTYSCGDGTYIWAVSDSMIRLQRNVEPPRDPCRNKPDAPIDGYCIDDDFYVLKGPWIHDTVTTYKVLAKYATGNGNAHGTTVVAQYPLNPARPLGHVEYNSQPFWEAAYQSAVDAGDLPSGLVYGVDYPETQTGGYWRNYAICTATIGAVSLADIIDDICGRVGITDIDVSDLEDITVDGYAITRVMPARSAIDPLRSIGFFDVIDSSEVLRFQTRGKPVVAVLDENDIGVNDGDGTNPPASISIKRLQDVEMPRSVRVHYYSTARDYEDGEQISPARLDTDAVNDVDVEIAVAMSDDLAAQVAEVTWMDAWNGRWTYDFVLDQRWLALEPGDPILLPVEGRYQRVRINTISKSLPILRKIEAVRDDDGAYVSTAVGTTVLRPPDRLTVVGDTTMVLMDLPDLTADEQANDPGFYVALCRTSGTTWPGAIIYVSEDAGTSFSVLTSSASETVIGTLNEEIGLGDPHSWDDENSILVTVLHGQFESRTEDAVLAGANALAIGADDRWQVIQFKTATQVATSQWRLSHLLQGRRGTEHLIGSAQVGDRVVLVSAGTIMRISLQESQIGVDRVYRAATAGTVAGNDNDQTFAGQGMALKPFSPVDIEGEYSGSDLVLTWKRRGRLGQELPDGSDIALSEDTEEYEIEIAGTSDYGVIVRTLTALVQTVTYTAAQQATDFPSGLPAQIYARIYQMSVTVGRGTPGYWPARALGTDFDPGGSTDLPATGGSGAESATDYLFTIKGEYPDLVNVTFEYRLFMDGYFTDVSNFTATGSATADGSTFRNYDDTTHEYTGGFGISDVMDVIPLDDRYFFTLQLFNGTSSTGAPGLIRKIDSTLMEPGGIVSTVTVESETAGTGGDPQSGVILGVYLYVACPYNRQIVKLSVADLSIVSTFTLASDFVVWKLVTDGVSLYGVNRSDTISRMVKFDTTTGGVVSYFPCNNFIVDAAIVGANVYMVSVRDLKLYKHELATGLELADFDMSTEAFSALKNYLTLDGTLLSYGRDPVHVLDTVTDEVLA